ncbi:MAG: hypothetical protein ACJ8BW_21965 [Ktedonobacteraceae bacterium]
MPRDTKIARVVANDNQLSRLLPLSRLVESLVDPSIEAEGSFAHLAAEN